MITFNSLKMVKQQNKDFTFELKQFGRKFTLVEGQLAPKNYSTPREDYIRSIVNDLSQLVKGDYANCIVNMGLFVLSLVLLVSCAFPFLIIFLYPKLPVHWIWTTIGTLCYLCCCLCLSFFMLGHESNYVTLPKAKLKLDQYLENNKALITEYLNKNGYQFSWYFEVRGEGNFIMKNGVKVPNKKIKPYCTGWIKFQQFEENLPHRGAVPYLSYQQQLQQNQNSPQSGWLPLEPIQPQIYQTGAYAIPITQHERIMEKKMSLPPIQTIVRPKSKSIIN